MENKEERKAIYEVQIVKHDGDHIIACSNTKYDVVYETWKNLVTLWTESIKSKVPMIIEDPIVTAFDPGLIKKIDLKPVMHEEESKYGNPYFKKMMKEGFSKTVRDTGGSDLLDEGYQ